LHDICENLSRNRPNAPAGSHKIVVIDKMFNAFWVQK
jgi:hypothetical protein